MFIEVAQKEGAKDALGSAVKRDIEEDLRVIGIESVAYVEVYEINAALSGQELKTVAEKLLADPITQRYAIGDTVHKKFDWEISVRFHPDVTDNTGSMAVRAASELLGKKLERDSIRSARKYAITGKISEADVKKICKGLLANELIENFGYRSGKGQ